MNAGRVAEVEDGTTILGESLDMMDWLQDCLDKLEAGREQEILSDPFYVPKKGPLSDEKVDQVIAEIDHKLDHEIDGFPSYHERRSGANAKTEFHRLGPSARRGLVEGLMRIIEDWDSYGREPVGESGGEVWC